MKWTRNVGWFGVMLLAALAAAAPGSSRTPVGASAVPAPPPATGLFATDPGLDHRGPLDELIRNVRRAPGGSEVRLMSWSVDDPAVLAAVRTAVSDGVVFKVIGSQAKCGDFEQRFSFLDTDRSARTWVRCVKGGGPNGRGMHQKSYLFERTGGVPDVTMVGSTNLVEGAAKYQWNDLFQYAGRADIYQSYARRFDDIAANVSNPERVRFAEKAFDDGRARATFLPVDDQTPTRTQDPVWERLHNLPTNPGGDHPTRISIAVYGMSGTRGVYLREKLVAMSRNGARIRFLAGPCVQSDLRADMRREDIRVLDAARGPCQGEDALTSEFLHLKAMTARYWENGEWNYRSYTGSANWSNDGLTGNFEVAQRMGGSGTYEAYERLFDLIWRRFG